MSTDSQTDTDDPSMAGPLAGYRVVELGVWVAGPAGGGILADWGADVVKIEPPEGDPARQFNVIMGGADLPGNPPFDLDNRGKRSVVLDLATEEGRAHAIALIGTADVFLTNIRALALARLGLDHQTVRALFPQLIYALVTGYGLHGPDADAPAYDIAAYWARSGLASLLTPPGERLPFQRGGMGDHTVGMSAAAMVSAALASRAKTGKGQFVSTSLFRQGTYTIGFDLNTSLMWGRPISYASRETMGNPAINNYTAGDGRRFWIVGLEVERHWPPMARALGHPEWLDEGHPYATAAGRFAHAEQVIGELDSIFATRSLAEWAEVFATEADFFWAPVNTVDDLLADEQFHASGAIVIVPDEEGGIPMLATPVDWDGHAPTPRYRAPKLGEHTEELLAELARSSPGTAPPVPPVPA
jgi:crotonobetainyl-CoA:carnitine CoA-transferase CaiB-like acyl-CoA transferase